MSGALEDDADPTFTHFAHRAEFMVMLERLLELDLTRDPGQKEDEEEVILVDQLGGILDYYLPLPRLLDPSLHEIVPPLMDALTGALRVLSADGSGTHINASRMHRLGRVINWVVKVRGWKAIITHFPSAISNLTMLINLLSPPLSPSSSSTPATSHHPLLSGQEAWEVRAVCLLWLSMLQTVPFDLAALLSSPTDPIDLPSSYPSFDKVSLEVLFNRPTSQVTAQVILLALPLLHRSGRESFYASLVLARLYSRSDAVVLLESFFEWAKMELEEGDRESEANLVAALCQFLAVLPGLLPADHLGRLEWFTKDVLLPHLRGGRTAAGSGLVRKLAVKAKGRWWVAKLGHVRALQTHGDDDLPLGLEEGLDDLMNGLSDKDTIVRYSCAKYLARLSRLLPPSLAEQIVLATIGLFGGSDDEPVICTPFGVVVDPGGTVSAGGTMGFGGAETTRGEARWHGCCLAIAEMARRGLINDPEVIGQSVDWVLKALTFDIRRPSHSIGANVRDAAAYLAWSLSRACSPAKLEKYAERLATALICTACFDREVGVRRAASAAFQEGVGRLGLYPEGIDVLGKTDFYSVSVRRIAFSTAAPAVAIHAVYRGRMREHLHEITLRHWDVNMRNLGATALKELLKLGTPEDLQTSIDWEIKQMPSLDPINVHGGLAALIEMCSLLDETDERRKIILHSVSSIRPAGLVSPQGADILQAACDLLATAATSVTIDQSIYAELVHHYIDLTMTRKESECYEAAGRMIGRFSELQPANREADRLLQMINGPRAIPRQVAALALGHVQYRNCRDKLDLAFNALLSQGDPATKSDVETRRYAIRSLVSVMSQRIDDRLLVSSSQFEYAFTAFLRALNDYSTDQRGDVGSWIRVAGLFALGRAIPVAAGQARPLDWVSQDHFVQMIEGIVRLGLEKLEPVRAAAWRTWRLLHASRADQYWKLAGRGVWSFEADDESDESFRYIDLRAWYSSALPMLETQYRPALLAGLTNSVGSQVESVSFVAFESLRTHLLAQPPALVNAILEDLQRLLLGGSNQNRIFLPTATTITRLIADERVRRMINVDSGTAVVSIINLVCRGIAQIKSIERITVSMKLVITCLALDLPAVRNKAIGYIPLYLGHRFPRVRAVCAESLYLQLSESLDELDEEVEAVLLETEWTEDGVGEEEGRRVVAGLKAMA